MGGSQTPPVLDHNNCSSYFELVLRFAEWAGQRGGVPLPEDIAQRFGVSKATAYRWRNAWCDANGVDITAPRAGNRFAPPAFPARSTKVRRQPAHPKSRMYP